MCGIFAFVSSSPYASWLSLSQLEAATRTLEPRGPDNTQFWNDPYVFFGFTRLAINDLSPAGNQPMHLDAQGNGHLHLVCNGEIYNHKELERKYGFEPTSNSDCEVILHLYKYLCQTRLGQESTRWVAQELYKDLDGEFAFVLYDQQRHVVLAARDPVGVRPLFMGSEGPGIVFASELKAITPFPSSTVATTKPFESGHIMVVDAAGMTESINMKPTLFPLHQLPTIGSAFTHEKTYCQAINAAFREAVRKRVYNSDRKVCALLSGGLDSSLVAALAAHYMPTGSQLETFSIGMRGSTDLAYAQVVADWIGSKHTNIELTEHDFLDAIPAVVQAIESYDTTSVRASVGNYLVSKYIRDNTDNKVVLNGDYSDEVCGGYIYLKNAPSEAAFDEECRRLVNDIYYFDSLRSDRCIAGNGLEARTPFSDKAFIQAYWSVPVGLRMSRDRMEKYMLRKAFAKDKVLPESVLWRKKEAFSDGVSTPENSWHKILTRYVEDQVTDEEFARRQELYPFNTPQLKETVLYRRMFESHYRHPHVIPYYWLPKWCGDMVDPSARELKTLYSKSE